MTDLAGLPSEMVVLAHGVGGRTDLPLSAWQAGWSAAVAMVLSFAALGLLWHRPRLAVLADGRPVSGIGVAGRWATTVVRAAVLAVFAVVLTAGIAGADDVSANLSPVAVYVAFWVAVPILSALVGPFWRSVGPWDTLARLASQGRPVGSTPPAAVAGGWLALVPVGAFLWLELVYHDGARPRVLGWAGLAYTVAVVAAARRGGTEATRRVEGFGVVIDLLARLAPVGRRSDGRWGLRAPLVGAAAEPLRPSEVGLVLLVLGGTGFDGVSRTRFWGDVASGRSGWDATLVGTVGLLWVVVVIGVAYHLAGRLGDRLTAGDPPADEGASGGFAVRFGHSLLPILLGYHVAHYFSLLVLEGQLFRVLASDPYGRGWDLFGTVTTPVDWMLVSPTTVGWVQLGSIVAGHLAGVVLAHDRSVASWRPATALRSQYPMLAVMVAYTVFGLMLMTG